MQECDSEYVSIQNKNGRERECVCERIYYIQKVHVFSVLFFFSQTKPGSVSTTTFDTSKSEYLSNAAFILYGVGISTARISDITTMHTLGFPIQFLHSSFYYYFFGLLSVIQIFDGIVSICMELCISYPLRNLSNWITVCVCIYIYIYIDSRFYL